MATVSAGQAERNGSRGMAEDQPEPPVERSDDRETQGAAPAETISSEDLFRGTREVRIRHAGEVYRLRLTRSGKLILHK